MRIALLLLVLLTGLRAADVAFVGIWDRSMPLIQQASAATGVMVDCLPSERFAKGDPPPDLAAYKVVLVLNIDPVAAQRILDQWKTSASKPRLVVLDARGSHAVLRQTGAIADDPAIPPYWKANGAINLARLLDHVAVTYLGQSRAVKPPMEVPEWGWYVPGREEPLADASGLAAAMTWKQGAPVAVILIQQSFWVTKDTQVIDLLADRLAAAGINPAVAFSATAPQLDSMLRAVKPDLLVEDRHGSLWEDGGALLRELDVPYLRPVTMLRGSVDEWRKSPLGMPSTDVALCLTLQECSGSIEPVLIGGLRENVLGFRMHEPIRERVERFCARAAAWARLRAAPNAAKRVALIGYNKGVSKGDLLRGSPTGSFLDGPRSLALFLGRLHEAGYALPAVPDERGLITLFQDHAHNIAPWDQADLERMADAPEATLVPVTRFTAWMDARLDTTQRAALEKHFGKPPGKLMVVERNGEQQIVLPAMRFGNLLLASQPERGERMDEKLLHSRDVPPPYHYLAFYWWLQEEFKADAVVHWGTHGTLELLPGKENGLAADDWSDVCAGTLPIVNLWIQDNLGEATLSRRRSYAQLVDHLVPPAVRNGLSDEEKRLVDDLRKHDGLEAGDLRNRFRTAIADQIRALGIDKALRLADPVSDVALAATGEFLHEKMEAATPVTMHVLGEPPPDRFLAQTVADSLGKALREALAAGRPIEVQRAAALAFVERSVLGADPSPLTEQVAKGRALAEAIRGCRVEPEALLRALSGRFIAPGPGPDPVRNPASVPTGRNLYALNPEEIPTRASWEAAKALVAQLLAKRTPGKVAVDLSGMSTMQDFGVTEGQILCLLGVEPLWDPAGLAADVRLIPREELGRPRVDVFVAMGGHYRENFPSRLRLIDKAVRLAAAAPEADNPVRVHSAEQALRLTAKGVADADELATARIFGTKPGNLNSTNILYLVPRSGTWKDESEITSIYRDNMGFVYTGKRWGEKVDGLYEEAMHGTDTVVHTWSSHLTSPMSNHHVYEYLGGLSMAITAVTGKEPMAFIADTRDTDGARIREFGEVLATTLQTELLARRWIAGMREHGYAGAAQIAEQVQNTFGWSTTRASALPSDVWDRIDAIYRKDEYGLDLPAWFERENPHAWQETLSTMLEASRKGYWKPSQAVLDDIAVRLAKSVVAHGESGGLVSGGNKDLATLVAATVAGLGQQPLADAYKAKLAPQAAPAASTPVRGKALDEAAEKPAPQQPQLQRPPAKQAPTPTAGFPWAALAGALAVLLVAVGVWRRIGAPK